MKFLFLLNPWQWWKARQYAKKQAAFDKKQFDLELWLYGQMLRNNMLHYGYFDDPDTDAASVSLSDFERAQIRYAEQVVERVDPTRGPVLDVGCGMGGLSILLHNAGAKVDSLSPNRDQIAYISTHFPFLNPLKSTYEAFEGRDAAYGTVVHSESLQYIPLERAFAQTERLLAPGGQWVVVDYFRLHEQGTNKSAHLLTQFEQALDTYGWRVVERRDITPHILPSLRFFNVYVERILLPVKHYAFEKLRYKKPFWHYFTLRFQENIDRKVQKERASIDPQKFVDEKKYLLFVLEKA